MYQCDVILMIILGVVLVNRLGMMNILMNSLYKNARPRITYTTTVPLDTW